MNSRNKLVALVAAGLTMSMASTAAGQIDPDERVIVFDTLASWDGAESHWNVDLHAWVFEPHDASKGLATILAALNLADVAYSTEEESMLNTRAKAFLVDNERGKTILLTIGDREIEVGETQANGHVHGSITLDGETISKAFVDVDSPVRRVRVSLVDSNSDSRHLSGWAYCLAESGVSVISDIDDTIKISNVGDHEAMLRNTFLKEFAPVDGISDVYRQWREQGVDAFHYLSASPWQLYEPLRAFIAKQGFPEGNMYLRPFRWTDEKFLALFESPEKHKTDVINSLVDRFSRRKFILVGDSSEKDAEIYGQMYRKHPDQIAAILIRRVPTDSDSNVKAPLEPKLEEALKDVPKSRWRIFDNASELPSLSELVDDLGMKGPQTSPAIPSPASTPKIKPNADTE